MSAEGFRDHVTTNGSLLGVPGRWSACAWSVVQLDQDEEMGPMRGMCGTLDSELEVQRTIQRANSLSVSTQESCRPCYGSR